MFQPTKEKIKISIKMYCGDLVLLNIQFFAELIAPWPWHFFARRWRITRLSGEVTITQHNLINSFYSRPIMSRHEELPDYSALEEVREIITVYVECASNVIFSSFEQKKLKQQT